MKMKYRIHPIFSDLIPAALSACDGVLFDSCTSCPHCGSSLAGYDVKKKHFADVIDGSNTRSVTVRIKRFRCRGCRAVVYADQPFYPNIRVGSPVVDLCVTLSARMPYASTSTFLQQIGVNVDRWSVRNYALKNLNDVSTTEQYGIVLPVSIVSLAALASDTRNGSSIEASEVLIACGYPSAPKKSDRIGNTLRYLLTGFLSEVFIFASFYSFY
jgi:hypothetical protein